MPDRTLEHHSLHEDYLATLLFIAALVAMRVIYITLCATPVSCHLAPVLIAIPPLGVGAYYTYLRPHVRIAALFNALGLVQLAFCGAMKSAALVFYSGRGFPLVDAQLAAIDQAFWLDWPAYVGWFDQHPLINAVAENAYKSILLQPFALVLLLVFAGKPQRLYAFISMMMVALAITSVTALLLPALGPYEFFNLTQADHPHISLLTEAKMTAPIQWLRAADFSVPVPPATVGLISFPSYHAATALIYIWAAWRVPYARWAVLILNAAMLAATPVHGSHYFVDVAAGIVIALGTIVVTRLAYAALSGSRAQLHLARLIRWSAWAIPKRSAEQVSAQPDRA